MSQTLKSLAKLALSARRATFRPSAQERPLIILGNGPGLRGALDSERAALDASPLMAVNFFANTPEFRELRPEFYVLADPHFFAKKDDPNVCRLLRELAAVDWPMTLFIPFGAPAPEGSALRIERYPLTAAVGAEWLEDAAYDARRGMPRPRNVLIPSIMIGAWLGFREIYLAGADHSWPRTVSVNERNEVVSVQPHFYKEDGRELERIRETYLGVRLHELLESWRIAFRSYHRIQRWASKRGIRIYNSTPGSFIDAFARKPLPQP